MVMVCGTECEVLLEVEVSTASHGYDTDVSNFQVQSRIEVTDLVCVVYDPVDPQEPEVSATETQRCNAKSLIQLTPASTLSMSSGALISNTEHAHKQAGNNTLCLDCEALCEVL